MAADFDFVMAELEKLGKDRQKKYYMGQGAHEPLFGTPTGAMKAILKQTGKNQALAEQLYQTGNYDAMYFAGIMAEPDRMTRADFERWMDKAYFYMISDFIVAVTLAESPLAQEIADGWVADERALYQSAGWSCYEWLLGTRPDAEFDDEKLLALLKRVEDTIAAKPDRVRLTMDNFVIAVGVSHQPLHRQALAAAETIGGVDIPAGKSAYARQVASDAIRAAADKGKLGFKRKNVRC